MHITGHIVHDLLVDIIPKKINKFIIVRYKKNTVHVITDLASSHSDSMIIYVCNSHFSPSNQFLINTIKSCLIFFLVKYTISPRNLSECSAANVPISPSRLQPIMLYLIIQSQPSVTIEGFLWCAASTGPSCLFPSSQLPRGLRAAVTLRSAMAELRMTLPVTATTWHRSVQTEKSRRREKDRGQ